LPIEEDGAGESVSGLAFVESDLHTPTKFRVFHPLQHEEGTLNAPDFTEGNVEAVLARMGKARPHAGGCQIISKMYAK
jgi:hypothetical protein